MERYIEAADFQIGGKGIPVVTASTGLGKTTFVISGKLRMLLEEKLSLNLKTTLILEANSATREQLEDKGVERVRDLEVMDLPQGTYTACFSVLANLLADGNKPRLSGLVVVDEADELARWSLCHKGNAEAWSYLLAKHRAGEIFLVLLTATPKLLLEYTRDEGFYDATPSVPLKYDAGRIEIVPHSSAKAALRDLRLGKDSKALVYMREAGRAERLSSWLNSRGTKSVFLISRYNETQDKETGKTLAQKMEEQTVSDKQGFSDARSYILKNQRFPDDTQVVIINDALATGVTIQDKSVTYVVVDSTELETVLQVKGRMRQNIEKLVVCYSKKEQSRIELAVAEYNQTVSGNLSERLELQDKAAKAGSKVIYLVYRDVETGEARLNPFARATYQEQIDMLAKLFGAESRYQAKTYWHALLPHSRSGLTFIRKEKLLAEARNKEKANGLDLRRWLNRKLFAADKKELSEALALRTQKRGKASWTTVKKTLKELGYLVRDSKTYVDSKQVRYSVIAEPQG